MLGEIVKYHGISDNYETDRWTKIAYARCIGYDENFIYTQIRSCPDIFTQHPKWQESLDIQTSYRTFRIGFHRSRFIEVVKECPAAAFTKQLEIFN